jgi:tRNA pseudouridine13 synthase
VLRNSNIRLFFAKKQTLATLKMASSDPQDVAEPPRKRQRLSPLPSTSTSTTTTREAKSKVAKMDDKINQTVMSDTGFQPEREVQVGILHFVNTENIGFTGTLKQRYGLRVSYPIASSFEMV